MMGNFFNRMYYGKGGNSDYTKDDLPGNRWQLFFAMVRLNIGKLVQVNLMFVVFFLPLFFWTMLNMELFQVLAESGEVEQILSYFSVYVYGIAPCLIIMAPAVTGMSYITRNMAKDQNVWIWSDFWYAIKQNWKQMLVLGIINALALFLGYVAIMFYQSMSAQNVMFMFLYYVVIVLAVVWIAANFYLWPMMVTYELKISQLLRNSVMMVLARLPQSVFMLIFTLVPPFLLFLISTNTIVMLVGLLVYALIGFSLTSLAINSVTNSIFDKYINVRIKGARVNQGLRIEYDDESDDEDDEAVEGEEAQDESGEAKPENDE